MQATDQVVARDVIESLRDGAVPRHHVGTYTVGRRNYLKALGDDLEFIANGGYKVRIVAGDWGYGKTHVLSLFTADALARGFAVAHVELHSREAPLERTEVITAAILRNVVFPGGLDLEGYLRAWAASSELLDRSAIEKWLQDASPSLELRSALRHVLASTSAGPTDDVADVVRWLAGGAPTSALTKATGIRGALRQATAPEILTSFLGFVQRSGSAGTILMLDEAEAITSLMRADKRDQANLTIKRLVDNPDQREHFGIVFATTNRFLDDKARGARSYPALWERIRSYAPTGLFNPRATVLQLVPLSQDELADLAGHLRALHASAYGWTPRLTDKNLLKIGSSVLGEAGNGPPRRFVRAIVTALDLNESDPALTTDELIGAAATWENDES